MRFGIQTERPGGVEGNRCECDRFGRSISGRVGQTRKTTPEQGQVGLRFVPEKGPANQGAVGDGLGHNDLAQRPPKSNGNRSVPFPGFRILAFGSRKERGI